MAGVGQLGGSAQAAFVLAPLAAYFLLLGLLNSRSRPQIVSSRTDFVVLNACMFPAFFLPAAIALAGTGWALAAVVAAAAMVVMLLAPPQWSGWTIYNIDLAAAAAALRRALNDAGEPFEARGKTLQLTASDARIKLRCVPLLRNVSISIQGSDRRRIGQTLDAALHVEMTRMAVRPTAAGATLVLVATALAIAPLGLLADRMPEMVRLIADLVK